MHSLSYINTHHDVTDLLNPEMAKNTKLWISWERSLTFLRIKNFLTCASDDIFLRSYRYWYSGWLFCVKSMYECVFTILSYSLIISLLKKTYKQLNHFIFGGINCLSFAITPSLDSCERVVRSFFAVLLCIMSISWFLAWHMYDSQHDWNSSASPRENSTNMGDEQGIYLIHQEQPLHEKCRNKEFFMLRIFQY